MRFTGALSMVVILVMGVAGCGSPQRLQVHASHRAPVIVQPVRDRTTASVTSMRRDRSVPAPVHLNQLRRSNTWYNFHFSSALTGYRWGGMDDHFSMQRTIDGGRHWRDISLPAAYSSALAMRLQTGSPVPVVQVVDGESIYVLTTDCKQFTVLQADATGRHWRVHKFTLPRTELALESVSLVGGGEGWALFRDASGTGTSYELVRFEMWQPQMQVQHVAPASRDAGLAGTTQATVKFCDPSHGWIVAIAADGKLHDYLTADGGATWHASTIVAPTSLTHFTCVRAYEPVMHEQEGTFVARYLGTDAGHAVIRTVVYHTNDGGLHLQSTVAEALDDATSDYMGDPVHWLDSDSGYAIQDSRLSVTNDSGRLWHSVPSPTLETSLPSYPRVLAIQFLSETEGFVLLQSRDYSHTLLLKTVDGGTTWDRMRG